MNKINWVCRYDGRPCDRQGRCIIFPPGNGEGFVSICSRKPGEDDRVSEDEEF